MVKNDIGKKARKIRELKSLTQEHLAKELGLTQPAYSNIEKGEVQLKDDTINKIANALGVSVDTLKNFNDEKYLIHDNNNSQFLNQTVNCYIVDEKVTILYEKNISLLEKELKRYKDKFGEI